MASSGSLAALWTPLEQSGYLEKKGHSRKTWLRLYFVLKGGYLFYFNDRRDLQVAKKLHGVMPLESAKIETELPPSYRTKHRRDNAGPEHIITITLHTSVAFACKHPFYVLRAPTQEVQMAWVNAMWQAAIPRADLVQHLAAAGKLADVVATYAANVQNAFPTADASVLSTGGHACTAALANVGSLAGMIRSAKFAPALSDLDSLPVVNPNQLMLPTQSILARTVSGNVVTAAPHMVSPRAIEAPSAVTASGPAVIALPPASPAPAPTTFTLPPISALPPVALPPASALSPASLPPESALPAAGSAEAGRTAVAVSAATGAADTAATSGSTAASDAGKEKGKEAGQPAAASSEINPADDAGVTTSKPATAAAAKPAVGEGSGIWGKLDAAISRLDATTAAVTAAKAGAGKVSQAQEAARLEKDGSSGAGGATAAQQQPKKERADAGVGPSAPTPTTTATTAGGAGIAGAAAAAASSSSGGSDGVTTVSLASTAPPKRPSPLGAKPSVTAELPVALLTATLGPSPRSSNTGDGASDVPKLWLDNPLAQSMRGGGTGGTAKLALRADEAAELLAKLDAASGPLPASSFKAKAKA